MKMEEKKKKRHIIRLYIRDVITKSLNRIGIKKYLLRGNIGQMDDNKNIKYLHLLFPY